MAGGLASGELRLMAPLTGRDLRQPWVIRFCHLPQNGRMTNNQEQRTPSPDAVLALSISFGLLAGVGLGLLVFDNLGIGIGVGVALGVAIGAARRFRR